MMNIVFSEQFGVALRIRHLYVFTDPVNDIYPFKAEMRTPDGMNANNYLGDMRAAYEKLIPGQLPSFVPGMTRRFSGHGEIGMAYVGSACTMPGYLGSASNIDLNDVLTVIHEVSISFTCWCRQQYTFFYI